MVWKHKTVFLGVVIIVAVVFVFYLIYGANYTGRATVGYRWENIPIGYSWNEECAEWADGNYSDRIVLALQEISNVTNGSITFQKVPSDDSDIMFICNKSQYYSKGEIMAEAKLYKYTGRLAYAPSKIYIYNPNGCKDRPVVLIHEILHLFGVEHSPTTEENFENIMFEKHYDCDAYIYPETVDYLKSIYG